MNFDETFKQVKQGKNTHLPQWHSDKHSKMMVSYLYVKSRFDRVPRKETAVELFADNWELVD